MWDEIFSHLRGLVTIGKVIAVDDSGQVQTVTVLTADGVTRQGVEVMMPFGFSSMPPLNGAICLVLAIGADPANLRALPVGAPAGRYGGQAPGEAALYASDGTRFAARQGGVAEVWAGSAFDVHAVESTLSGNVQAAGNVRAGGTGQFSGTVTAPLFRGEYQIYAPCLSGIAPNDFITDPMGGLLLFPEPG